MISGHYGILLSRERHDFDFLRDHKKKPVKKISFLLWSAYLLVDALYQPPLSISLYGSKQFLAQPIGRGAMFEVPPLGGLANNPMRKHIAIIMSCLLNKATVGLELFRICNLKSACKIMKKMILGVPTRERGNEKCRSILLIKKLI